MAEEAPLLRLENISKTFYGNGNKQRTGSETRVLSGVTLDLRKGEILALVGENGAGKTTLTHILFGMPHITTSGGYQGTVRFNGKVEVFKSPRQALNAGIGLVHQDFSLIPGFTAAENIMLNREPLRPNLGAEIMGPRLSTLRRDVMAERANRAAARLGVNIEPDTVAETMPVGHRQFTEIAREIDRDNMKLLILDEPTAALTETEADMLLDALRMLARRDIAIIFVSHRLKEVVRLADRVAVLRDGVITKDMVNHSLKVMDIASWIVGRREAEEPAPERVKRKRKGEALKVSGLAVEMPGEAVWDVSFTVRKGEVFGIGGLSGQGKLGIPNGVMGRYPARGEVWINGAALPLGNTRAALDAGIAFVSEDRRGVGLLLEENIAWNIAFAAMQIKGRCLKPYLGGLLRLRDEKVMGNLARKYIKKLGIKCAGPEQKARELSGGNQQKLCLAGAFALEPKLLFVAEPTRGIDVGAKELVLNTLRAYNREHGAAMVVVSSELGELRALCDRVAIAREGRIAGILGPDAPLEAFGRLITGEKT